MQPAEVQIVVTDGQVGDDVKERARRKLAQLEQYAPRDFLYARVEFSRRPTQAPSTSVHGVLDVQGNIVQARLQASEPEESLDLLVARLQSQLRRLTDRLQSRRQEPERVDEGEWRHGALPTPRPDHFPRPADEREIVERVTHARGSATPEEAAFDLDLLDDDWLLYEDETAGSDAVIRRRRDGAYGVSAAGDVRISDDGPYTIEAEGPPAEQTVVDALERLRTGDEGHVFFLDPETGRGAVAYWRYDGHYGIVRPRTA